MLEVLAIGVKKKEGTGKCVVKLEKGGADESFLREVGCVDLEHGDKRMRWRVPDEAWDGRYGTAWDGTYAVSSVFNRPMEGGRYAAVWCAGTAIYARENGWDHFQHGAEGLDRSRKAKADDLEAAVSPPVGELTLEAGFFGRRS